jgi:GGDEF domain-containing protein
MRDFFISYTKRDVAWAEWIARTLEDAGYTTYFQKWDFPAGSNFILEMHNALEHTDRTLLVMSKAFNESLFTKPEWAATIVDDPTGAARRLVPVRVDRSDPIGLLKAIAYIDLVGKTEPEAQHALLTSLLPTVRERSEPSPFTHSKSGGDYPAGSDSADAMHGDEKERQINEGQWLLDSLATKLRRTASVRTSIAILDVDGMTGINTRFGEAVGNAVIGEIVSILTTKFWDEAVGRCGDDTFFLTLTAAPNSAARKLRHLVKRIAEHDWAGRLAPGLAVTVSGCAAAFSPGESAIETVARAALGCRQVQLKSKSAVGEPPKFLSPELRRLFGGDERLHLGVRHFHS